MKTARNAILVLSAALLAGAAYAAEPAAQAPAKAQAPAPAKPQAHEHRREMRGMSHPGHGCPGMRHPQRGEHEHS